VTFHCAGDPNPLHVGGFVGALHGRDVRGQSVRRLIVVGCGLRAYREYSLATLARVDELALVVPQSPTWPRKYIATWGVADTADPAAMLAAVSGSRRGIGPHRNLDLGRIRGGRNRGHRRVTWPAPHVISGRAGRVETSIWPVVCSTRRASRSPGGGAGITLDNGTTHVEIRLARRGQRVVEINGRLGGDLIPYLGMLATGIDLPWCAASVAFGERTDVMPTRDLHAELRFLYPPHDGVLELLDRRAG